MMKLTRQTLVDFFKFGIVGFLGFIIDTAIVYGCIWFLDMERVAAGFTAFPFAVTFTWIGNRLFTFRHLEHEPLVKQWSKFFAVCAVGIVFNRGTYTLCVTFIPLAYDHPVLALLAGTAAGMFFNFFVSKKLVFK